MTPMLPPARTVLPHLVVGLSLSRGSEEYCLLVKVVNTLNVSGQADLHPSLPRASPFKFPFSIAHYD